MKEQAIFDYYITPDGEIFNLRDYDTKFILGEQGFGMPTLDIKTQRAPFQHGVTWIDYFLQPRTVTLVFRQNTRNYTEYWQKRGELIDIFRPNRQNTAALNTGTLRRILPSGDLRDIDVIINQGLQYQKEFTEGWDEFSISEAIQFVAFDPTFYNPTEITVSPSIASLDNWVLPWVFDVSTPLGLLFGATVIDETFNITYSGTWRATPTIIFTGALSAPKIENVSTGDEVGLDYAIPSGRVVTVNCAAQTVEDDLGNNLIGYLTDESDLSTFYIATNPEVAGGVNEIRFTASGVVPNEADMSLVYNTRYIGL